MSLKKQNQIKIKKQVKQIVYDLQICTRTFFWRNVDRYFYHNTLDNALIDNRNDRVSKSSSKKQFDFNLFQSCNLDNHLRFILEEEVSVSFREIAAILNTLRQFLKEYGKAVKFPSYCLPKQKQEIGYTFFAAELLAHYFQDNE